VLGDDIEMVVTVHDESNERIRPAHIARQIHKSGGLGLVGMVGVQTNQYPRAVDLGRQLRADGIQVCIGGFHVSGCLAMLPELTPDLKEAMNLGISLFAGEAEGRLESLLQDALEGNLQLLYNFMKDLPDLAGAPLPSLSRSQIRRTSGALTSLDAGRGCPFQCSFCSIINVQGRKSRVRTADDVEQVVRRNLAQGIYRFFITDDNFARNSSWEPILDRLIHLREVEGKKLRLIVQVDTLCHKIPRFIEKCGRAGVTQAFIGMESINPEALAGAKKKQNNITEYRKLLQAWHEAGAMVTGGYILGFPTDTAESIAEDIEIIKRELPIDVLEFFIMTPGPGSEDHQKLYAEGVWMDPDFNKYDSMHVTTGHPRMSAEEWQGAFDQAWKSYYTYEHVETVMRRARGTGTSRRRDVLLWFYSSIHFEGIHPLDGGFLRLKSRRDRRPGMPLESPFVYYPRRAAKTLYNLTRVLSLVLRFMHVRKKIRRDPARLDYMDVAVAPVHEPELEELDLFTHTTSAKAAAAKALTPAAASPTR
jgi:hypothetical protein